MPCTSRNAIEIKPLTISGQIEEILVSCMAKAAQDIIRLHAQGKQNDQHWRRLSRAPEAVLTSS